MRSTESSIADQLNKWHSPLVSETSGWVGIAPRTLVSFVKDNSNAHPTTVAIALAAQMVTELLSDGALKTTSNSEAGMNRLRNRLGSSA
jgi:hypothetical protein